MVCFHICLTDTGSGRTQTFKCFEKEGDVIRKPGAWPAVSAKPVRREASFARTLCAVAGSGYKVPPDLGIFQTSSLLTHTHCPAATELDFRNSSHAHPHLQMPLSIWRLGEEDGGIHTCEINIFGKPPNCFKISRTHEPATIGSLSCGCWSRQDFQVKTLNVNLASFG